MQGYQFPLALCGGGEAGKEEMRSEGTRERQSCMRLWFPLNAVGELRCIGRKGDGRNKCRIKKVKLYKIIYSSLFCEGIEK